MTNSNVKSSIIQLEEKSLRNLVTEVKETLATDFIATQFLKTRTFGVVDLWKCQRKMRTATSLRKF